MGSGRPPSWASTEAPGPGGAPKPHPNPPAASVTHGIRRWEGGSPGPPPPLRPLRPRGGSQRLAPWARAVAA
eukprot:2038548-Lingulodinium_polyedra.AAC.1